MMTAKAVTASLLGLLFFATITSAAPSVSGTPPWRRAHDTPSDSDNPLEKAPVTPPVFSAYF